MFLVNHCSVQSNKRRKTCTPRRDRRHTVTSRFLHVFRDSILGDRLDFRRSFPEQRLVIEPTSEIQGHDLVPRCSQITRGSYTRRDEVNRAKIGKLCPPPIFCPILNCVLPRHALGSTGIFIHFEPVQSSKSS